MAETWFAIYREITGELVSVGTAVAEKLPTGLKAIPLTERPDFGKVQWDAATRTLKARLAPPPPPETQLDRIEANITLVVSLLNDLLARLPARTVVP